VVAVSATLITLWAAAWTLAAIRRLPQVQVLLLSRRPADVQAARQRSLARSAEVREAAALLAISAELVRARHNPTQLARLSASASQRVASVRTTQLGRVQQAAVQLVALHRTGAPLEQWWPRVQPFLVGLEQAHFAHHQAKLLDAHTRAYETLHLSPAAAYGLAEYQLGQHHGGFLQLFAAGMQRLIAERQAAGDREAVRTCRAVLRRLLQQWVLEPGPAGLRLLAAELLVRELPADAAVPALAAISQDLRRWRAAYNQALRTRPADLFALTGGPALCPTELERMVVALVSLSWVGVATVLCAAFAAAIGWAWIVAGGAVVPARLALLHGAAIVAVVLFAGQVWVATQPKLLRRDLHRQFDRLMYWPRHPFAAAGLTLLLLGTSTLLISVGRRKDLRPSRLPALGATAVAACLWFGAVLFVTAAQARAAVGTYLQAQRAVAADPIGAVLGADGDGLLQRLRSWDAGSLVPMPD